MRGPVPNDNRIEVPNHVVAEHPYVPAGVLRVRVAPGRRGRGARRGRARGERCGGRARGTRGGGRARGARGGGRARGARGGGRARSARSGMRGVRRGVSRRRCKRVIIGSSSSSSSSEEEFVLSESESDEEVVGGGGGRRYPDYLQMTVNVPAAYFSVRRDIWYRGVCKRWGQYTNTQKKRAYGYYVHFEEGDRYWMLEEDVHTYLVLN